MGMPMELNTMIVTKEREVRIDDKLFYLVKDGYRLYPLHIPLEVKPTIKGELTGVAEIIKLEWEQDLTTITFRFIEENDRKKELPSM